MNITLYYPTKSAQWFLKVLRPKSHFVKMCFHLRGRGPLKPLSFFSHAYHWKTAELVFLLKNQSTSRLSLKTESHDGKAMRSSALQGYCELNTHSLANLALSVVWVTCLCFSVVFIFCVQSMCLSGQQESHASKAHRGAWAALALKLESCRPLSGRWG